MIKKIVLGVSVLGLVAVSMPIVPTVPARLAVQKQSFIDIHKKSLLLGAALGSLVTACAPTVINTTKNILNNAWQQTKRAAAICGYYAIRIGTVAAGGVGTYKVLCGTTSAERACGLALVVGTAATLLYSQAGNQAPAPRPAAPGGPAHGGHVHIGPIGVEVNYIG